MGVWRLVVAVAHTSVVPVHNDLVAQLLFATVDANARELQCPQTMAFGIGGDTAIGIPG